VAAWRWREALLVVMGLGFASGHGVAAAGLLAIILLGEVFAGEPLWVRTPLDPGLWMLCAAALASGATSEYASNALVSAAVLTVVAAVVVRATVLAALRRSGFGRGFLAAWAAGGVAAGVWAIARLGSTADARTWLPYLTSNELGTTLATAAALLAGFVADGRGRRRLAAAAGLAVVVAALGLTWSRGAWLAAAAGLAVALVLGPGRGWRLGLLVVGATLLVMVPLAGPRLRWHLDRLVDVAPVEGPFSRVAVWRIGARVFAERPLLGSGLSTFGFMYERHRTEVNGPEVAPSAHNLFLNVAAELGAAGLMATGLLIGAGVRAMLRWRARHPPSDRQRQVATLALAAATALLVHQLVDGTIMFMTVAVGFFALLGLAAAGEVGGADLRRGAASP
jgi:O-antigen ligase